MFPFFFYVVLLFSSPFSWCCFPFPPLGNGAFRLSSVGWCGFVHPGGVTLFFRGAAFLPVGLLSSLLVFLLWVVLPFCRSFWWDYFSPVFCWLVLHGPILLEVVLRPAMSPPPLGGVAFPISFQVVLPSLPSFWWGCLLPPFLGGHCFSFCWVVLLGLLLLWAVVAFPISFQVGLSSFSSFWWGCLPPPPLGGAAFSHLLKGGAAWFPSPLRGAAFLPLICVVLPSFSSFAWCLPSFSSFGVGLRSPSLRLGGAAWSPASLGGGVAFPISFQVILPSFSSFWWDGLPPPPLGGAAFVLLLKGGAAWFPSSLCGVAFLLSFLVVLLSFPSFG